MATVSTVAVSLCLVGCGSPDEPAPLDGTDVITTPSPSAPPTADPPTDPEIDRARQILGGAQISPDGRYSVTGDGDRVVIRTASGTEFDWFGTGSDWQVGAEFSPDGQRLAVGVQDAVVLYDFATKDPHAVMYPIGGDHLTKPRFSGDGAHLVVEEFDKARNGRFVVFDVRTERPVTSPYPPYIEVSSDPGKIWYASELAVFDGGAKVIAAGEDGFLLWSTRSQKFDWVPCGCRGELAAVDRAGRHVAFGARDGSISMWTVSGPTEVKRWKPPGSGEGAGPPTLTFTEDGRHLLSKAGKDGYVWSVPEGKQVGSWRDAGA